MEERRSTTMATVKRMAAVFFLLVVVLPPVTSFQHVGRQSINSSSSSMELQMSSAIQTVPVGNKELLIRHQMFLGDLEAITTTDTTPLADGQQPQPQQRPPQLTRDLTGLKYWPTASLPMIKAFENAYLPALLLSRRMEQQEEQSDIRILELGAGCGLLGIGLASLLHGRCRVVLTDADVPFQDKATFAPPQPSSSSSSSSSLPQQQHKENPSSRSSTLQWLQDNVTLNQVGDAVTVQPLAWGNVDHMKSIMDDYQTTINNSNKQQQSPAVFDIIVGSELLYNNDHSFDGLLQTLVYFVQQEQYGKNQVDGSAATFTTDAPITTTTTRPAPMTTTVLLGYKKRNLGEQVFFDKAQEFFDITTSRIGRKQDGIYLAELTWKNHK